MEGMPRSLPASQTPLFPLFFRGQKNRKIYPGSKYLHPFYYLLKAFFKKLLQLNAKKPLCKAVFWKRLSEWIYSIIVNPAHAKINYEIFCDKGEKVIRSRV